MNIINFLLTTTTTINPLNVTSIAGVFATSLTIQFFGLAMLLLAFGIVYMRSKNIPLALLFTTLVSWILLPVGLVDIVTSGILTTFSFVAFAYYVARNRHKPHVE